MSRQVFRQIIFAFAVVTILLVGSVCGNGSVDLGADVDGSSVLLESSTANDPMTGVQISGRRRVVAVRKRTQTATTPTPTQTSSGDVEVFEPLSAEDVEAMKRIAQHPPPEEALDSETIRLLDSESTSTEPSSSSSALKRPRSNSMEKMPPVKDRKINEQQSIPINQVQKPTAATKSRRVVRKPVTSKPRKMVNRTPKAQGMSILQPTVQVMLEAEAEAEVVTETETEADAEQENALTTGVSVYPTFSLGQVVGGVTRTIGMLRNAIQADPATVACPGGVAGICKTANHFTYVLDPQPAADLVAANAALAAANTALATANANGAPPGLAQAQVTTAQNQVQRITSQIGRMHRAFGWVRPPVGLGGTNPTAASTQYCDVLFKPTIPFATGPLARPNAPAVNGQAGRNLWPTGHIMGDALGGMNNQPLNFFPQYRWSNAQSGRWGKAEAIALQVAGRCAGGGARVAIQARFTAWDARGIYPAGGHYTIYANAACVAALGAGCTQNGAAGPAATAGNANVRTFCRWSTPTGNGGLRYSTPFSNGITDRVMSRPIAQRRRFFP